MTQTYIFILGKRAEAAQFQSKVINMPERVTREERMVSLAIEKARKVKQELSAKKRMNIEPTQVNEFDSEVEVQKIKRPKVQDASKITNQTQDKEGYGLAGETLKKSFRFYNDKTKELYEQTDNELSKTKGMNVGKFIGHLKEQMNKQPVLYERDIMNAKQMALSDPRNQNLPQSAPQPQMSQPTQPKNLERRKKWSR